jgi:hypothetical protein
MKSHWHELIQRYVDGQGTTEEAAALQEAMKKDANLRALYLDYMNLDVALGAAAELTTIPENGTGGIAASSPLPRRTSPRYERWLAGAAACASLILFALVFALVFRDRNRPQPHPDINAACCSTQAAIVRLSIEPPSYPEWMSPTASMLDPPRLAKQEL